MFHYLTTNPYLIMTSSTDLPEALAPYKTVIIIFIIMIIAKILLDLYLKTKSGYLLRAVGDNETIVTSLAKTVDL